MRAVFGLGMLLSLLVVSCGAAGRDAYQRQNEALLGEFPVFPGAVEVSRETSSYYRREKFSFERPDGYTTRVEYGVPAGTMPAEVESFYAAAADSSWEQHLRAGIRIHFCRGFAMVAVETNGVDEIVGRYWMVADYRFVRPGERSCAF